MSKTEIIKYLIANNTSIPVIQILSGLLVALCLSVCIYIVYRKTYTGVMYSKDFNITILMLALITTFIIMIIGSNLALSLGLVGALSIIRFRTAVKNSRDAAFLFWAIGVGLSCGTGVYTIGIIGSVVIGAVLLIFHKLSISEKNPYLLVINGSRIDSEKLETSLKKGCIRFVLRMTNQTVNQTECTYELLFGGTTGDFLNQLHDEFPDLDMHLLSYQGELGGE